MQVNHSNSDSSISQLDHTINSDFLLPLSDMSDDSSMDAEDSNCTSNNDSRTIVLRRENSFAKLEFKNLIERQKSYLQCLKNELRRLKKMEKFFASYQAKLAQRSKKKMQFKVTLDNDHLERSENESQSLTQYKEFAVPKCDLVNKKDDVVKKSNKQQSKIMLDDLSHLSENLTDYLNCKYCSNFDKRKKTPLIRSETITLRKNLTFNSVGVQTTSISSEVHQIVTNNKIDQVPQSHNQPQRSSKFQSSYWCISPPRKDQFRFSYQSDTKKSLMHPISLQQALEQSCPQILKRSKARTGQIQMKSEIRKRMSQLHIDTFANNLNSNGQVVEAKIEPKDSISAHPLNVLTEKEMRRQTEKRYSNLSEVKKRIEDKKREHNLKTFRLMSRLFSNRLRKKALQGQTNLPITQTIQLF